MAAEKKREDKYRTPQSFDRIRVVKPGIWIILIAIVLFMTGFLFWVFRAEFELAVDFTGLERDNRFVFYIDAGLVSAIPEGTPVVIEDKVYTVSEVSPEPLSISFIQDRYLSALHSASQLVHEIVCEDTGLEDGYYSGNIKVETIHPVRFLLN